MKNKTFYDIVSKTKLITVFENNKVMYETYFGVQGPGPEPGPKEVYMSITGHPYSADVGSLVKSLLQVTVVYDDGSSVVLEDTEYQTNNALIYEGPNEIIVTYKKFKDTCTIIGLQPQPENPLSRDFTLQEVFDEFDTAYQENRTATNPYGEDTFYRRTQPMQYDLTDQGLYMTAQPTSGRSGVIKSMNLATAGKYRVDVDIKAWVEEEHGGISSAQNTMSIYLNNNSNADYFGFLLQYSPDDTYSLDLQYRDASNGKVTHASVLTDMDASQFIKYSVVLDFDTKTIDSYVNDALIETYTDNPKMELFGGVTIAGTNNNSLKSSSPIIVKSITVTEVQ